MFTWLHDSRKHGVWVGAISCQRPCVNNSSALASSLKAQLRSTLNSRNKSSAVMQRFSLLSHTCSCLRAVLTGEMKQWLQRKSVSDSSLRFSKNQKTRTHSLATTDSRNSNRILRNYATRQVTHSSTSTAESSDKFSLELSLRHLLRHPLRPLKTLPKQSINLSGNSWRVRLK